jgi:hypothetical protein
MHSLSMPENPLVRVTVATITGHGICGDEHEDRDENS